MSINVVSFEVTREVYTYPVTVNVERTFSNILQATGYIKRHRDELRPRERFGLVGVTDSGERITLH